MIIIDCLQNTPEWDAAHIGIPTASKFDKIISPTGQASKQWEAYAHEILAEEIIGRRVEGYKSPDMSEGQRREEESASYYEMQTDMDTRKVGFLLNDARTLGCSPDRLVGEEGLVEFKNPKHGTPAGYLLAERRGCEIDREYWPQLQGQLYISERKWVDIVSYYPGMPALVVKVERDEPYINSMAQMLSDFNAKLAKKRARLIELGHLKPKDLV
jgi:hypothetical protein